MNYEITFLSFGRQVILGDFNCHKNAILLEIVMIGTFFLNWMDTDTLYSHKIFNKYL